MRYMLVEICEDLRFFIIRAPPTDTEFPERCICATKGQCKELGLDSYRCVEAAVWI